MRRMIIILLWKLFLVTVLVAPAAASSSESMARTMDLASAIETALDANLSIKSSQEAVAAAEAAVKASRSRFFPTFSASYQWTRSDEATQFAASIFTPQDQYQFLTTISQPIFSGFSLENQYKLSRLGLDIAQLRRQLASQDVILRTKDAYFSVLKAEKLLEVARQTVIQITEQKKVAQNFYEVGMTPLNDLLEAEVELANAEQEVVVAENNLDVARSNFNLLLRRPLDTPVKLADALDYLPFIYDLEYCLETARNKRLEVVVAEKEVDVAEKEVDLAKQTLYPSLDLRGSYFRLGDEFDVDGGEGIFDPDGWTVVAVASWDFWEWGRTTHGVTEKLRQQNQAEYNRDDVLDRIMLEVKSAFLRTKNTERFIRTVEKSIEQAKENLRINQERYREQVANSTEVTIAQTLLTRTMTNYYNALYEYQITKAELQRAMGEVVMR